jgi:hypothetical protein
MEPAYSKDEDVNDNSIPLLTPDKSIGQSSGISLHKLSSLSELDLSETNQHFDLPPSFNYHECTTPKSTLPNKTFTTPIHSTKDFTPYTLSPALEESQSITNKSIANYSSKKLASGKSVNSLLKKSVYPPTESISGSINPKLCAIRTSMGVFNSVSQYTTEITSVVQEEFLLPITKSSSQGKPCTCQKSKCLKLYCECFAKGKYCEDCSCTDCHNIDFHKQEVSKAKEIVRGKNPLGTKKHWDEEQEGIISCKCSKSECIKNYCECYKKGRKCGTRCDCIGCKNSPAFKTILCKNYDQSFNKDEKESI